VVIINESCSVIKGITIKKTNEMMKMKLRDDIFDIKLFENSVMV